MKKSTIINERNAARLQAELDEVQSRARTRKIDADHLLRLTQAYHEKLKRYMKVKNFDGIRLYLSPYADRYPKAYKYRPEATAVEIEYDGGTWRLIDVDRTYCDDPKDREQITYLPPAAQQEALSRLLLFNL